MGPTVGTQAWKIYGWIERVLSRLQPAQTSTLFDEPKLLMIELCITVHFLAEMRPHNIRFAHGFENWPITYEFLAGQ